jgi:hypothetical protein
MPQNINRDLNQTEGKIVSDISLKRLVTNRWGRERDIYLVEGGSSFYPLKRCCKLANGYFVYGHI